MYRCSPNCKRYINKEDCPYYTYKFDYYKNITIEYCMRSKTKNFFSLLRHSQEYLRYYIMNKAREEKEKFYGIPAPEKQPYPAAQTAKMTNTSAQPQPVQDTTPQTVQSSTPNIKDVYRPSFSDRETILSKFIALISEQNKTLQMLIENKYSPTNISTAQEQLNIILDIMKKIISGEDVSEQVLENLLKFPKDR